MVDATKACESAYMDVELVQNSKTKKAVIINGGQYVTGQYGERLQIEIEIDGKNKKWSPNRSCCQILNDTWGKSTDGWVGKVISLQLEMNKQNKLAIVCIPQKDASDELKQVETPFLKPTPDVELTK